MLEGQARVSITSMFIILGWWGGAVPLSFLSVYSIDEDDDPCVAASASALKMQLIMWSHAAGFLACDLMSK